MRKKVKHIGVFILQLILLTCLCLGAQATEAPQELKVGYVSNYGTLKAAFSDGSGGYGYEYLTHLVNYMEGDYKVTFVSCGNWQDGMDKLDSGEIDIMGPTMEVADSDYIHTDNDFGTFTIMLAELSSSTTSPVNTTSLDGATIGVPDYYSDYSCLTDFLATEDIDATIVSIPSLDLNLTLGLQDIDYVMMSSLQTHAGLTVVTGIGAYPAYFVASPENQELMDEMDRALVALSEAEPYFRAQLAMEYSSYNFTTNAYISEENLAIVQEKGVYTVGIRNFCSPLIREGADGELEGVGFVLLDLISQQEDISFEYVVVEENASTEDFEGIDFLIAATSFTDDYGFPYVSSSYLDLPFILLEHRESSNIDMGSQTIGVANYYRTDALTTDGTLYGREVVRYGTVQELQQAFDANEIDCMLITVVSLNMIRDDFSTQDYVATTVEDSLQLSLAFSENMSAQEITVFNKLIATIDQAALEAATLEYSSATQDVSLQMLIANNPWIVIGATVVVLLAIFVTALFFLVRRRKEITKIMNVDRITGIMTEHKFMEEARRILSQDKDGHYRLVTMDIDNFKYVNEIYGYEVGTTLLQILGRRMNLQAEGNTIVARGTADRFMLMAPMINLDEVTAVIQEDMEFTHTALKEIIGKAYKLYFSIGIYDIYDRNYDITVMLDYANSARQQGKVRAGNSVSVFTTQMQQQITNNNHFTSIMEQALEDEEFILHFQPKVSLENEFLAGAEVLVRWQRAAECMPPYHFIPLFEKNGFIEELDYYVLAKSCAFLRDHPSLVKGRLSVNLSGVTMLQDNVVGNVVDIVARHQILPTQLDLEITETAFVEDRFVLEKIQELRNHGFTISMDDFGAGVSSLNRLKNIHVDTLKIDREFIIDAIENPRGNQILKRVIQMADDLHLETVAEGIETVEQGVLLRNLGCNIGQGYHYARPMSEEQFIDYCKARPS